MATTDLSDGVIPILLPNTIRGQNSSVHPTALSEGEFPLLQNLRISERLPVVRNGSRRLTVNPPDTGLTFRGAWSGTLGSTAFIISTYETGGSILVYSLNVGNWTWTEISSSSGYFGNTRLTAGAFDCEFVKVPYSRDGVTREVLLIYSQTSDYPRVFDPAASAGLTLAKMRPISLPGTAVGYKATQTFPVYVDLQSGSYSCSSQNTGIILLDSQGSAPNKYLRLKVGTSSSLEAPAKLTLGVTNPLNLSNSRQLLLRVLEAGSGGMMGRLKVQISEDDTTYHTIGDATDMTLTPVTVSDSVVSGVTWFAYSLDHIPPASRDQIRYIRFYSQIAGSSSTSGSCRIALVVGSGNIAGLSDWCVAFRNHYSRVESPRQVLGTGSLASVAPLSGCNLGASNGPVERIPNSSLLYYAYTLAVPNPNSGTTISGDIGAYPTKADFYIRYSGTESYSFFGSSTVYQTSSGSWTGTSGSTLSTVFGTSQASGTDETLYPPDSMHGYIPRPTCMLYNGSRLLMGGDYGQLSDVYFSDDRQPFRFRQVARFIDASNMDPGSGSRISLPTPVVGIGQTGNIVSGVEFGVPTMVIWTQNEAYRLYGIDCTSLSRPTSLGPHGLAKSKAVARYEYSLYWLDDERQVRKMSPDGIVPISRGSVDVALREGEVSRSSAAFYQDRLYLAYRHSGDNQTVRLLVWDEHPIDGAPGSWTEDLLAAGAEQLLIYDTGSNAPMLLFFTANGHVWQHEDPSQSSDNGTPIQVKIVTREFQQAMWKPFWIRSVGIVADGCLENSSMDIVARYKPNNATASWSTATGNSLSLYAGSEEQVWRRTTDSPVLSGDIRGLSCQIEFVATMPSQKRLYAIRAYVEPRDNGEDQA